MGLHVVPNPLHAHATGLAKGRSGELDTIKAIAIVSVLLLHAVPFDVLHILGSPFLVAQAVPLFLLTSALSWSRGMMARSPAERFRSHYRRAFLVRLFTRVFLPFLALMAVVVNVKLATGTPWQTVRGHLLLYGAYGPGGYFPWVYLQAALLFPLLWSVADRAWPGESVRLLLVFILAVGLDAASHLSGMTEEVYRLLVIRYVFLLYLGTVLARWRGFPPVTLIILGGLGLAYLALSRYAGVSFAPLLHSAWPGSHAPASGWALVMALLICKASGALRRWPPAARAIEALSKASYEIFLTQMAFFGYTDRILIPLFPVSATPMGVLNLCLKVAISVLACVAGGLVWYAVRVQLERRVAPAAGRGHGSPR